MGVPEPMKRVDSTMSTSSTYHLVPENNTLDINAPYKEPSVRKPAVVNGSGPWNAGATMTVFGIGPTMAMFDGANCDSFQLRAEVASFQPRVEPIHFLNTDSVPDVPRSSTKGMATQLDASVKDMTAGMATLEPIGSGSARSSPDASSMFFGPAFTTDTHASQGSTSRYVCFYNIPHEWIASGVLMKQLNKAGLYSQMTSLIVSGAAETTASLYAAFDDIRIGAKSHDVFAMILSTSMSTSVSQFDFYALDKNNPKAASLSEYEGQVEFCANVSGDNVIDKRAVFDDVLAYANSFGLVRTFALYRTDGRKYFKYRAEYFSLRDASTAITREYDVKNIGVLLITTCDFSPSNYRSYAHPANDNGSTAAHTSIVETDGHGRNNFYQTDVASYDSTARQVSFGRSTTPDLQRRISPIARNFPSHRRYGAHRDQNKSQSISFANIHNGVDTRTTVMIRNIPSRVNAAQFKALLDISNFGTYDFSYLRIDFKNGNNVGYAFVNFCKPENIIPFMEDNVNRPWRFFGSNKMCEISYATIQSVENLIEKFRNSSIMQETLEHIPKLWYTYGANDIPIGKTVGDAKPFPSPNNNSKLARSVGNAQTIGLYPPRGGPNFRNERGHRSQYDRGNPQAAHEERMYDQYSYPAQRTIGNGHQRHAITAADMQRGYVDIPEVGNMHGNGAYAQAPIDRPMAPFQPYAAVAGPLPSYGRSDMQTMNRTYQGAPQDSMYHVEPTDQGHYRLDSGRTSTRNGGRGESDFGPVFPSHAFGNGYGA